jgi:membrane protein DedA with SNARE-associated domain
MFHALHSLLPHVPHYGSVLVFIAVLLNNLGIPVPGEAVLLGAGFILGQSAGSLWQPMLAGTAASFLGGLCAFWLGRRLGHGRLETIHWLHLTPERLKWPERYFQRHGAKAVFIARFIAIFPPIAANLLAGMTKMSWRLFIFYNLTGSAASTISYILIGYLFGRKWQLFEAWAGPAALYPILAAIALIVPAVIFRHALSRCWVRLFPNRA